MRELLAPREDVWGFLAEPRHLADWWPDVSAVEPDRRGLAPGARWQLRGGMEPTLFRRARASGVLVVQRVEREERFGFHLVRDRLDVDVALARAAPDRTIATVSIFGPWWVLASRRSLAREALERLWALCQTAAEL